MTTKISYDYELLRQPLPLKTLTGALHFRALHDAAFNTIIFSVDRDGRLLLMIQKATGDTSVFDLTMQLASQASDKVNAFAVSQDKDFKIYLAFATGDGKSASKLWVLSALPTSSEKWYEAIKPENAFQNSQTQDKVISKLLIGSVDDGSGYPFLAAVFSKVGSSKQDVVRADIDIGTKTWQWTDDLSYPFNIDSMTDYCVGAIPGSTGIFGLDYTQGKPRVTFAGISNKGGGRPRAPTRVNLPVVANPKCIATTRDEDGLTNLLVGGDGIFHIASQNCTDSVNPDTVRPPTLSDAKFWGTTKLEIAQSGTNLAIWALNGDKNIVGQKAKLKLNEDEGFDEMRGDGDPVPLFSAEAQLFTYDAVFDPKTQTQQVFCLKQDGSVSCLRQSGDTKVWAEQALRIPDPEDVQDINTYACNIRFRDSNDKLLSKTNVLISTSSQISCQVNGNIMTLNTTNTKVKTDSNGVLSLVLPAPDMHVPSVTVSGPDGVANSFNPALKVITKLSASVQSGSIDGARGKNNELLFPNLDEQSKAAITQISAKFIEKANGVSNTTDVAKSSTIVAVSASVADDHAFLWHLWHGIVSGVEKILGFAYEAGVFIIRTVKKVWKFIIDTAGHALSALSGLFKLIGAAIEDAITWLAEKLDWSGILDTCDIFNEIFDTGFDLVQELIAEGGDAVDKVFASVEKEVGSWHLPPELPQSVASLKPDLEKGKKSQKNDFSTSPGFNWLTNHLESGDSKKNMGDASKQADSADFASVLEKIYNDFFKPLWDNFKDTLSHIWDDIKELFNGNSDKTWGQVLKNIGVDILLGIIRGIRKAVHGILSVSEAFLSWIRALLNEKIDIWVVTKLFKKITKGKELTIKNLSSLILAIPATWAFRIITGKGLRDFPQIDQLLKDIQSGKKTPSRQLTVNTIEQGSNNGTGPRVANSQASIAHRQMPRPQADMMLMAAPVPDMSIKNDPNSEKITGEDPKVLDLNSIMEKPKVHWLKYVWRLGNLVVGAGKIVYTLIDTVITGFTWRTLGPDVHTEEDGKWKKGPAVYVAIVMTFGTFPFEKFARKPAGVTFRMIAWGANSTLNIIKAGLPEIVKPGIAGLAGVIDMICYVIALIIEGSGGDGALEWSQRLLTDAWAIGSAYNSFTGAKELWGLSITIGVGAVMNVEGIVLAGFQVEYFVDHGWDEKYDPPSWATSINGSLL